MAIAGLTLALAGLVALLLPGLSAPPLGGALLMLGACLGIVALRVKGHYLALITLAFAEVFRVLERLLVRFAPAAQAFSGA